jgi:hypothetical protein
MGLVRLPCFFNRVQRIEKYSTTSSKMIKKWKLVVIFSHILELQAPDLPRPHTGWHKIRELEERFHRTGNDVRPTLVVTVYLVS